VVTSVDHITACEGGWRWEAVLITRRGRPAAVVYPLNDPQKLPMEARRKLYLQLSAEIARGLCRRIVRLPLRLARRQPSLTERRSGGTTGVKAETHVNPPVLAPRVLAVVARLDASQFP
jgi:antitoxin (DNA-binding transcriptional repressor) of toxin-antitoxin stability system